MRALIFASVLGYVSAAPFEIEASQYDRVATVCPYPGNTSLGLPQNYADIQTSLGLPQNYADIQNYFGKNGPWQMESGYDSITEADVVYPHGDIFAMSDDNYDEGVSDEDNYKQNALSIYRAKVSSAQNDLNELTYSLLSWASRTGVIGGTKHADAVRQYTDFLRKLATHADDIITGRVKSTLQLLSIDNECLMEATDLTHVNQDALNEWKLGPFDTAPEVGVNAGNCTALETAYRGSCGCGSA